MWKPVVHFHYEISNILCLYDARADDLDHARADYLDHARDVGADYDPCHHDMCIWTSRQLRLCCLLRWYELLCFLFRQCSYYAVLSNV